MRSGVTTGLRPRFRLARDASLSAVAFDGNCASVTATILLTLLLSFSLWIRIALAGCSEGKGQRPASFRLAISLATVSGRSLAITNGGGITGQTPSAYILAFNSKAFALALPISLMCRDAVRFVFFGIFFLLLCLSPRMLVVGILPFSLFASVTPLLSLGCSIFSLRHKVPKLRGFPARPRITGANNLNHAKPCQGEIDVVRRLMAQAVTSFRGIAAG
jgi:hypothetical protein